MQRTRSFHTQRKQQPQPRSDVNNINEVELDNVISRLNTKLKNLESKYSDFVSHCANAIKDYGDRVDGELAQASISDSGTALSMYNELQGQKKRIEKDLNFMMNVKNEISGQPNSSMSDGRYQSISEAMANIQNKILRLVQTHDQATRQMIIDSFSDLNGTIWQNLVKIGNSSPTPGESEELRRDNQHLVQENKILKETIDQLNARLNRLHEKIIHNDSMRQNDSELETRNEVLQSDLNKAGNIIKGLQKKLAEATQQAIQRRSRTPEQDQRIKLLQLKVNSLEQELNSERRNTRTPSPQMRHQYSAQQYATYDRGSATHRETANFDTSPQQVKLQEQVSSLRQKLSIALKERDLYKSWKENFSRFPPPEQTQDTVDGAMQYKLAKLSEMVEKYIKEASRYSSELQLEYMADDIRSYLVSMKSMPSPENRDISPIQRDITPPRDRSPSQEQGLTDRMLHRSPSMDARNAQFSDLQKQVKLTDQLRDKLAKYVSEVNNYKQMNRRLQNENALLLKNEEMIENLKQKVVDKKLKYSNFKLSVKTQVFDQVTDMDKHCQSELDHMRTELTTRTSQLLRLEGCMRNIIEPEMSRIKHEKKESYGHFEERKSLMKDLEDRDSELSQLRGKINELIEIGEKMKTQMSNDEVELKQFKYERQKLEKRNESLQIDLRAASMAQEVLHKQLFDQQQMANEKIEQLLTERASREHVEIPVDLSEDLKASQNALTRKREKYATLKEVKQELDTQKMNLQSQFQALTEQAEQTYAAKARLLGQLEEQNMVNKNLRVQLSEKSALNDAERLAEIDVLSRQLKDAEKQAEGLFGQLQEQTIVNDDLREELAEKSRFNEEERLAEMDVLARQLKDAELQAEEIDAKHQKQVKELSDDNTHADQIIKELRKQLYDLDQAKVQQVLEIQQLHENILDLEADILSKSENIKSLQEKNAKLLAQLELQDNEIVQLQAIAADDSKSDKLMKLVDETTAKLINAETEHLTVQNEYNELEKTYEEAKSDNEALKNKRIPKLDNKIKEIEEERRILQEKLQKLFQSLENQKEEAKKKEDDLNKTVSQLTAELQKIKSAQDISNSTQESQLKELESQLKQLQNCENENTTLVQQLSNAISKKDKHKSKYRDLSSSLQDQNAAMNTLLTQHQGEVAELKSHYVEKVDELLKQLKQLADEKNEIENKSSDASLQTQELATKTSELTEENRRLNEALDSTAKSLEASQTEASEAKQLISDISEKLSAASVRVDEQKEELEACKAQNEVLVTKLSDVEQESSEKLQSIEMQAASVQEIANRLEEREQQVEQLQRELEEVKAQSEQNSSEKFQTIETQAASVKEIAKRLEESEQQVEQLKLQIAEAKAESDEKSSEKLQTIETQAASVKEMAKLLQESEKQVEQLNRLLEEAKAESDEKSSEKLQTIETQAASVKEMANRLEEKEKQVEQLQIQLEAAKAESETKSSEKQQSIETQAASAQEIAHRFEESEIQVEQLQKQLEEVMGECVQKSVKIKNKKSKYSQQKQESIERIAQLEQNLADSASVADALRTNYNVFAQKNDELTQEKLNVQQKIDELTQQNFSVQQKKDTYKKSVADLKNQTEDLRDKLSDSKISEYESQKLAEEAKQTAEQLEKALEESNNEIAETFRRLLKKGQKYKKQKMTIEDITSQVYSFRKGEEELTRTLDNKNKIIQSLTDQCENLEAAQQGSPRSMEESNKRAKQLEIQLMDAEDKLEDAERLIRAQTDKIAILTADDAEIQAKHRELEELKEAYSALEESNGGLEKEIERLKLKYDNDMLTMTKNQESLDQEFTKYKEKMREEMQEQLAKVIELQRENDDLSKDREPAFLDNISEELNASGPNLSPNLSVIEMQLTGQVTLPTSFEAVRKVVYDNQIWFLIVSSEDKDHLWVKEEDISHMDFAHGESLEDPLITEIRRILSITQEDNVIEVIHVLIGKSQPDSPSSYTDRADSESRSVSSAAVYSESAVVGKRLKEDAYKLHRKIKQLSQEKADAEKLSEIHQYQISYLKDEIKELQTSLQRSQMGETTTTSVGNVSNMDVVKENYVKLVSTLPNLSPQGEQLVQVLNSMLYVSKEEAEGAETSRKSLKKGSTKKTGLFGMFGKKKK